MWIVVTLVATVFQTVRTAAQGRLRDALSVNAAGFVRYVVGAPLALAASLAIFTIGGQELPSIPTRFWFIVALAGVAQIVGTIALITAFDQRDFAIGTVYSKTEVIQVAVFSAVLVGEPLRPMGWVASMVVLLGVIRLAVPAGTPLKSILRLGDRAAIAGVIAGGGFALAATGIRWASTSLGDGPAIARAVLTLAAMNTVQTVVNALWLAAREPTSFRTLATLWRRTLPVGILSVAGSAAWAIAMSLESAAKVRTLGQAELLLAFVISHRWLREHHRAGELVASGLVLVGIIGVTVLG
ncbi:MAG: EamA family transporter [Actinomycetota bacterium]|nr:EamA family transporter [Actinomycetota bacterium]MDA3015298.1 EamA family transporter [Actinomycetota bacterium]MDA3028963.1 EamA family transporter [Actinomycetota bacterium]